MIIDLVKKAKKGNEKAYLELFQLYEQDIYRIAYVYLANQDDALDVVQETAYRSYKAISGLKEPRYFKSWLIKIAISCAIDMLRKRKNILPLKQEYEEWTEYTDKVDIPLSLSLRELIYSLDEEEKNVIILKFYQDYTIKEVSRLMNIPLGTAKTILYRALKKLRKWTEEDDYYGSSYKN